MGPSHRHLSFQRPPSYSIVKNGKEGATDGPHLTAATAFFWYLQQQTICCDKLERLPSQFATFSNNTACQDDLKPRKSWCWRGRCLSIAARRFRKRREKRAAATAVATAAATTFDIHPASCRCRSDPRPPESPRKFREEIHQETASGPYDRTSVEVLGEEKPRDEGHDQEVGGEVRQVGKGGHNALCAV